MKISITHELTVFLIMTALGIFEGILFDVFRVWRKMLSKSFLAVGVSECRLLDFGRLGICVYRMEFCGRRTERIYF